MKTFVNDDVVWRRHDGLYDIHDGINWRDVTNSAHVLILHQIVVVSTRYQMTDFGSLRLFRKLIIARKQSLRRLCFYTCLSFCSRGGGCLLQCMLGYTPPSFRADTPPHHSACWEIRTISGRYASYWNTYLFMDHFSEDQVVLTIFGQIIRLTPVSRRV